MEENFGTTGVPKRGSRGAGGCGWCWCWGWCCWCWCWLALSYLFTTKKQSGNLCIVSGVGSRVGGRRAQQKRRSWGSVRNKKTNNNTNTKEKTNKTKNNDNQNRHRSGRKRCGDGVSGSYGCLFNLSSSSFSHVVSSVSRCSRDNKKTGVLKKRVGCSGCR